MASIFDEAKDYEPEQMKNIADLDVVDVNLELLQETFKEGTPDEFKARVIKIKGENYRVPVSVLKALKTIREDQPNLKHFKVKKSGEGMKTEYVVIPLE